MDDLWFHPDALAEYRDAALRYKQVKPELGRDFRNSVEKAIAAILETPTRFGPSERGIRRYLLKRFPYKIYFVHDPARDQIVIYAVMHVSRHPEYWKSRYHSPSSRRSRESGSVVVTFVCLVPMCRAGCQHGG